jgi:hypothetical protein
LASPTLVPPDHRLKGPLLVELVVVVVFDIVVEEVVVDIPVHGPEACRIVVEAESQQESHLGLGLVVEGIVAVVEELVLDALFVVVVRRVGLGLSRQRLPRHRH